MLRHSTGLMCAWLLKKGAAPLRLLGAGCGDIPIFAPGHPHPEETTRSAVSRNKTKSEGTLLAADKSSPGSRDCGLCTLSISAVKSNACSSRGELLSCQDSNSAFLVI